MTDPGERITLAAGLVAAVLSDDEVLVQYGTRSYPSELLRDTDLGGVLARLFRRVEQGPATRAELLDAVPAARRTEAGELVDGLLARGLLTTEHTDPVAQYLDYTFTGRSRLGDRRVAVIGAGPLGGRIVPSLVDHGIGSVAVLDDRPPDPVAQRFAAGSPAGSGVTGAATAAGLLRASLDGKGGPVEVVDAALDLAGVRAAADGADLVVLALERPDPRLAHLVNRVCLDRRTPWLHVVVDGNSGTVGPLFLPPETGCYNDFRVLTPAAAPNAKMSRAYARHDALGRVPASFFPGLPAYADVVSGFASVAVVHQLVRGTAFALGRAVTVDFDRLVVDVEDLLRLPRCPVCGVTRRPYQPVYSAEIITRSGPRDGDP